MVEIYNEQFLSFFFYENEVSIKRTWIRKQGKNQYFRNCKQAMKRTSGHQLKKNSTQMEQKIYVESLEAAHRVM